MFYCPNCHESIADDNAQSCPHCGSDAETGWKPDVDYHSLELPEDEDFDLESSVYRNGGSDRLRALAGPVLMGVSLALFVVVGYQHYRLGVVLPAVFLAAMAVVCLRILAKSR
jgi:hypothetical protein